MPGNDQDKPIQLAAAGENSLPFVGGILSVAAGAWSKEEQEFINNVFKQWLQMLQDELREKSKTIIEIMARLDTTDERIKQRIEFEEYQSILKKAFRGWSRIDFESKRQKIRNFSETRRLLTQQVMMW